MSQQPSLVDAELLTLAQAETARLEKLVKDLDTELFQMSQHYLRMGWHRGFDDYYAQRREITVQRDIAIIHLGDSWGQVMLYRKRIAEGYVRPVAVAS